MATSTMSLLAFLLPLVVKGLQSWANDRKGGNSETNIQEYRKALSTGDSRALVVLDATQHDRVLALCGRKR